MTEIPNTRRIFCNRTLNLRSIQAIGYDMDYTLVHYHFEEWERRAYNHLKEQLAAQGWPVQHLEFDPTRVSRGLVIDRENGNLVKPNRFGFIKQALHGTQPIDHELQRQIYSRTIIDLAEKRWIFLNTLFSLSEGCIYAQLVDLLDSRQIPEVLGYSDLYDRVFHILQAAHMEGQLKSDIIANPDRYVILDPETPLTLLDQFHAGKKLLLITNSEWNFTFEMMTYSFNRFLPKGMTWKDLFEIIIVGARKPQFFTSTQPFFEVVTQEGLLKPTTGRLQKGVAYLGGSAAEVEKYLKLSGDEILYVGDHMFGDVHVTKNVLRWRTALILRELEQEIVASQSFHEKERQLISLMKKKEELEHQSFMIKIQLQRVRQGYGPRSSDEPEALEKSYLLIKEQLDAIDHQVAPLAKASTQLNNPTWGLLMRSGNDKSYLAYQMERYADIYTSRVSNLLYATPFSYLRSPRGSLPHDTIE